MTEPVPPPQSTSDTSAPAPDDAGHHHPAEHGYTPEKAAYLKRLRRIEGQIRGLERMVADDVYCIDVLTQISAATKALQAVGLGLLEDHLRHCVVTAAQSSTAEGEAKVKEATDAIRRFVRS